MSKKIAICHYRVGGTDGVSLEIEKRKKVLEDNGYTVKLIAGPRSKGANYIIDELEWDELEWVDEIIPKIKKNIFRYFNRNDLTNREVDKSIKKVSRVIQENLNKIQEKENFDFVLIHNIFSFGGHIAAAKAFADWVEEFQLPTIATHHDFFWERKEYRFSRNEYFENYLKKQMPPKSKFIKHVVINSLAQKQLKKRRGIDSVVFPDIFDFEQPEWKKDSFNKDLLKQFGVKNNDLVILQATRVIPRKGIEIAIDFSKELQKNISFLRGKEIYNGKKVGENANVFLIVAGYAEDEKRDYLFQLKNKVLEEKVRVKFIADHVQANRSFWNGVKTYSLWDAYAHADLVTFPSSWEGWGNQFIEAIFAKKPVALFEYPVYEKDIALEGYEVISFGNKIKSQNKKSGLFKITDKKIRKAGQKATRWLLNKNLNKKLENNFEIGKKFHGCQVIEDFLLKELRLKK